MGDRYRFRVFAQFIRRQFPEAYHIADVAGGRGLLSIELMFLGVAPVVIEPRHVDRLPRKARKKLQVEALRTGHRRSVQRIEQPIEHADLSMFDLIAGLHPDQATEPIIRQAVGLGKPFAVVPCCVMPCDMIKRTHEEWLAYLIGLAPGCSVQTLPMAGANVVIAWRPGEAGERDAAAVSAELGAFRNSD